MLPTILLAYSTGAILIGLPILAICVEKDLPLTDEMALAVIVFYPIVVIALLIYGIIKAIQGLLAFIILLFKGEIF